MKTILLVFIISLVSCTSSETDDLEFLLFAPAGYSNSRSAFFMIYADESSIKGLIGPGGERTLQNKALLKEISAEVHSLEKKEAIYLKYSVTLGVDGNRFRYLLTENWLPILKKIKQHCHDEQISAIRMMIYISDQSKESGFDIIEK